jgi:hypothetical protein
MTISKYNLIKFIIDVSLRDHEQRKDPDWQAWFKSISRIYNHKMPEHVIKAIASTGNAELLQLCNTEMTRVEDRLRQDAQNYEVYKVNREKWIHRISAGNLRAQEARLLRHDADLQKAKHIEKEMNESYVEQMMPEWTQCLEDIIRKRDASVLFMRS